MGVFIFLFSLLFVLYLTAINNQQTRKSRIIQTAICTIILIGIQGLRHECVGIDSWNSYRPFFDSLPNQMGNLLDIQNVLSFEPGFVVYTKIVKSILDNTQFYIILSSIISIVPISVLIYRYAKNIPFAFIIFSSFILYHFGFSGIRQAMAIGITAIAFEFIIEKKLVGFVITVIIASSLHVSSILFLIAYPLYHHLRLYPTRMILVGVLFIFFLFFLKNIVIGLTEIIFGGEKYMNKAMEDAIPSYNLMILLAAILFFSFLSNSEKIIPLRSMLLMCIIFQSLGLISSSASRMAYYFMPYIAIAIPMTTSTMKNRRIIETALIGFFVTFFFYCNAGGYLEVIPYKFFWE